METCGRTDDEMQRFGNASACGYTGMMWAQRYVIGYDTHDKNPTTDIDIPISSPCGGKYENATKELQTLMSVIIKAGGRSGEGACSVYEESVADACKLAANERPGGVLEKDRA